MTLDKIREADQSGQLTKQQPDMSRVILNDQKRQRQAKENKRPKERNILTGSGYPSEAYRNRLDQRGRSGLKPWEARLATRETIVKDVIQDFDHLLRKLMDIAQKQRKETS